MIEVHVVEYHDCSEKEKVILQMAIIQIQRDPLFPSPSAVNDQQQRNDDPRAKCGHKQIQRLRDRPHLEWGLRVEELEGGDGREDLRDADQHELGNLER